jgi:hypothetical protein
MMHAGTHSSVEDLVAAELARPPPPEAQALAAEIIRHHGDSVNAVLFYGSCRRTGDMSGLLDLYVLHNGHRAFHGRRIAALLNRLLPPNVVLLAPPPGLQGFRAKVAIMSERQFAARVRRTSWDTTIWARFSQPASLLYARNQQTRSRIESILSQAVWTAAFWASKLSRASDTPADVWQGLFAQTYRAEIRPERYNHPELLYSANVEWFDSTLSAARAESPTSFVCDGKPHPPLGWVLRRLWGKPLNLMRIMKAVFTFDGGLDYVIWKLRRHSGIHLTATAWQRRHPILAAPNLLWRLRRMRMRR